MYDRTLVVWVSSFCRSTLSTYESLKYYYPGKVKYVLLNSIENPLRMAMGFQDAEFKSICFDLINPKKSEALAYLKENRGAIHLFTSYHGHKNMASVVACAANNKFDYCIGSESPENMESELLRKFAKEVYLFFLRFKLARVIRGAKFILNYSGEKKIRLLKLGWDPRKIIRFGYFPPGFAFARNTWPVNCKPDFIDVNKLNFLVSGSHSCYRNPILVVNAVKLLLEIHSPSKFHVFITGCGEQTAEIQRLIREHNLPISLLGVVSIDLMYSLYRYCDIFVAPGSAEPWGVRVNDALSMGLPAIVSSGMGVSCIVEDFDLGKVFNNRDILSLRNSMMLFIESEYLLDFYRYKVRSTYDKCSPRSAASLIATNLLSKF